MKLKLIVIIIFLLSVFTSESYAQKAEEVGAGVIDFLLSNPKTANKLNSTQGAALNVLGSFLKTRSSRKHDMNVSNAGRNQIILNNTESGKQVTVVQDQSGNMYLLSNGTIYPISNTLINQATKDVFSINNTPSLNSELPNYNITNLKQRYHHKNSRTIKKTYTAGYNEYVSTVERKIGQKLEIYNISSKTGNNFHPYYGNPKMKKIYNNKKPLPTNTKISYSYEEYINQIQCLFTFNWYRDTNEDGLGINDFNGIKRSFLKNEEIKCLIAYYLTEDKKLYLDFEIIDNLTGETLNSVKFIVSKKGEGIKSITLENEKKIPGKYTIYAKLKDTYSGKIISNYSEKFEIIDN